MKPRRPDVEQSDVPEQYIDTPRALEHLVEHLRTMPRVAVDTEFVRDRQYDPRLELVQVATDGVLALVDYRRLRNIVPLLDVLHSNAILKVVHAGRQDIEIFYNLMHRVPTPLFDTQVAASVLGMGAQLGYADMVDRVLGISLPSSKALTNWSQRPLTGQQIAYALDDVRYLLPLHDEFERRLDAAGRLSWFIDEMATRTEAHRYARPDPRDVWRKIGGISRMSSQELAVLREVAAWRETVAQAHDRALSFIASDGALKQLARRQPKTIPQLHNVRGLRRWSIDNYADDILSAVAHGLRVPPEERPQYEPGTRPLTEDEAALVDLLEVWAQRRAEEENVAQATLVTRDELRALVLAREDNGAGADLPVLRGWRREVVGEDLKALVAGAATLVWNPSTGRLEVDRIDT